ncbi:BgTH12-03350 [Blumeria graminis f. sp. triticale]|uniref:BgTH12-03350 n=1 Tax=Blumeria graminis f. sp. triticale TaxID=1689686 RepID=A0A9W4GG91_BLUGR|nr:BgTH12-03350 [Blumeria graminis f. sp. triticale]
MIRYRPEFKSFFSNKGIRITVKVADNNNSDDNGAESADLKSTKTGKNKYILPKGEKEEERIYHLYPSDRCKDLYKKSDGYKKKPEWRYKARGGIEIDSDDDSSRTYIPKWAKETPNKSTNTTRSLMDLDKLYINPQDKFGTRHYEVLENKLRIFFENAGLLGLEKTYSKMLSVRV